MKVKEEGQAPPQEQTGTPPTPTTQQPAAEQPAAPRASPAISGHFQVVGVVPGKIYHHGIGHVDLRTVSLAVAQQLHEAGCQYLKPIVKP